jgi:predicted MarR family transcription regulator
MQKTISDTITERKAFWHKAEIRSVVLVSSASPASPRAKENRKNPRIVAG